MADKKTSMELVPAAQFLQARNKDLIALIPYTPDTEQRKRYLWQQIIAVNQLVKNNPKLAAADQETTFVAFSEGVMLGLDFGATKEAHLVPFKGKTQLIIGYSGLRRLAKQAQKTIVDIETTLVYEGDYFDYQRGLDPFLKHKPARGNDRGEGVVACYTIVYLIMPNGNIFKHWQVIESSYWEKIRNNSPAYRAWKANKIDSTPWADSEPEMIRKTCLRYLLKDFEKNPMLAQAEQIDYSYETGEAVILDAEFVDKAPQRTAPPASSTAKATAILDQQLGQESPDIAVNPQGQAPRENIKKVSKTDREKLAKRAKEASEANPEGLRHLLSGLQFDSTEALIDATTAQNYPVVYGELVELIKQASGGQVKLDV